MFFFAIAPVFGQKKKDSIDYQKLKVRIIDLSQPKEKVDMPVSSIVAHDYRYDTTCIGFVKKTDNTTVRLELKSSVEKAITDYYSELINLSAYETQNPILHCYIKKLQLTDAILIDDRRVNGISRIQTEEKSGVLFKAEFYGQYNDVFIPLCRFDTTLYGDPTIWLAGQTYLEQAIAASVKQINSLNWKQIMQNGKRLSKLDVSTYNEKHFQIPVLQEAAVKGVYLSFQNFIQNKPLQISFIIKKGGNGVTLQNQKGTDSVFVEAWGYCDGKDRYIFSDLRFFKLQRHENGFLIYGANRIKHKNIFVPGLKLTPYGSTDIDSHYFQINLINRRVYQLDMENGSIH